MPEIRDDDYASMVALLEGRLTRRELAQALGIRERVLDEISAGHAPEECVAERLRVLASLALDADLADPASVARLLGVTTGEARRMPLSVAALLTQRRTIVAAWVLADLIAVAIVAALALGR